MSSENAVKQLNGLQSDYIKRSVCRKTGRRVRCNRYLRFRTITGLCNNILNPRLGAANTQFKRFLFPNYADGLSKPRESRRGALLPNARLLSRKVQLQLDVMLRNGDVNYDVIFNNGVYNHI